MIKAACLLTMVTSVLSTVAQAAAQTEAKPRKAAPPSEEMVWSLGWDISSALVGQVKGNPPEAIKPFRESAEQTARDLSIALPPFPVPGADRTKNDVAAINYILDTGGKPLVAAVESRFDKRHAGLLGLGMRLPLLTLVYAPGGDMGLAAREGVAVAAMTAGLPPTLFKTLFDKVDAGAPWPEVMREAVALRQGVLTHLRAHPLGSADDAVAAAPAVSNADADRLAATVRRLDQDIVILEGEMRAQAAILSEEAIASKRQEIERKRRERDEAARLLQAARPAPR
jgi:hypothetical protein